MATDNHFTEPISLEGLFLRRLINLGVQLESLADNAKQLNLQV